MNVYYGESKDKKPSPETSRLLGVGPTIHSPLSPRELDVSTNLRSVPKVTAEFVIGGDAYLL